MEYRFADPLRKYSSCENIKQASTGSRSLCFSHPDPEHGLYDGIRVEVGPDSNVTPRGISASQSGALTEILSFQLLQHQIGASVFGDHGFGVSFCHHLQLPEQGEGRITQVAACLPPQN